MNRELVTVMPNQEILRQGMMLVRRRDGVLPDGRATPVNKEFRQPVAHIVLLSTFPDTYREDVASGTVNADSWSTCCGVVFVPGTAEVMSWADQMPHPLCVKKASLPPSAAQRVHDEARESDIALRLQSGSPE